MSPLHKQAMKVVNAYVEEFGGNLKEVRRQVLIDVDLLFTNGSTGARLYAQTLDAVYHELCPKT